MAEFVPTKGYQNCPKCNGWQVLDFTKRAVNGWPIGKFDYRDCDHCNGRGEVPSSNPTAWPIAPEPSWQIHPPKPKPLPKSIGKVELDDDIPVPDLEPPIGCPHNRIREVWGRKQCEECTEWLS